MKLSGADQKTVNDFFRNYVDGGYKNPMNAVRLNVDHTDAHRRTIFEVCNALLDEKIPFWTEVRLKCGCIPDVVAPTHVVPIIEVLSSETEKQFYDKKFDKYPSSLQSHILVNALQDFDKDVLF